ncbi:hypothetical protein HMPREF0063_10056 [Aeromicrobium marinum DSM 15272]|uniref:Uncharacterized protein n=1 Tax=Aeromicrobium marinum DSM 15272 TaxID=585531 RepID=E2S7P9_9ACTN|nr:hypothetical protein [Aeromicrobium marinum]EFQ84715.1 hypothetical protein HMPREF0063_10056 [Aeromicrobium marinum DSM 15272]
MTVSVTSNAAQVSVDLGKIGMQATRRLSSVIDQSGIDVRDTWQENARETSGAHGSWYPSSIRSRMVGPLTSQIGPREGMKQAGMSFEHGSRNQTAHLSGQMALDEWARRIERRIETAVVDW